MRTEKSYYVHGWHTREGGALHQIYSDTFDEARKVADAWVAQGSVLVHITEQVFEIDDYSWPIEKISDLLVWAAASPEVDWR